LRRLAAIAAARSPCYFSIMGLLPLSFASAASPGEDPFDLAGDLLDGQFRVEEVIGEGELSVVYRGLHEGVNAPIAIKCLNLPLTLEPKLVSPISESFREGARLHYQLAQGHLHIVQSLAYGETLAPRTGQVIPYLVREWLEGRSLSADFAERARAKSRPRTPVEAVELLESAADALAYAHAEGVAHHSLSPRNLFLAKARGKRGREVLKVLDFGMARSVHAHALGSTSPLEAPHLGLRLLFSSYAAPEQLDRRIGEPCAATDVFAFALVLFEAVTGRPYFPQSSHPSEVLRLAGAREALSSRVHGASLPGDLEAVLARALAPKPSERHADLRALWDDVKGAVRRPSSVSPSTSSSPRRPDGSRPTIPVPVPVVRPPGKSLLALAPPPPADEARESETEPAPRPSPHPRAAAAPPAVPISSVFPVARDVTLPAPRRAPGPEPASAAAAAPLPAPSPAVLPRRVPAPSRTGSLHGPRGMAVQLGAAAALVVVVVLGVVLGAAAASRDPSSPSAGAAPALRTPRAAGHVTSSLVRSEARSIAPRPFDRAETRAALDATAADLESCAKKRGPRGPGSIRAYIHPNGKIVRLQIGPPYAGTETGRCIRERFVATPLPPFTGPLQAFNYVFLTIPWHGSGATSASRR
jgi:eukaryotic-like serine/threonine-protein kinase